MNRRDFLRSLVLGAGAVATGVALVEPEPVRRFWQVGRGAPVGEGALIRHLRNVYGDKIQVYGSSGPEHGRTYDIGHTAFSLVRSFRELDERNMLMARYGKNAPIEHARGVAERIGFSMPDNAAHPRWNELDRALANDLVSAEMGTEPLRWPSASMLPDIVADERVPRGEALLIPRPPTHVVRIVRILDDA